MKAQWKCGFAAGCASALSLHSTAVAQPAPPDANLDPAKDLVVVTASRTQRPLRDSLVATQVITALDIQTSGAENLSEVLDGQPGISVTLGSTGDALQIHGLPADYTLILVDGVRVPGRVGGVMDLRRFPLENIERIEIVRGSGSALYGSDAIAGVINLITRRTLRSSEVSGSAGFGPFNTQDASISAGLSRPNWSARGTVGLHSTDGFDLDASDLASDRSAARQYNGSVSLTTAPTSTTDIKATGEYLYRRRQAVDVGASGAVFDRTNITETASLKLAPQWRLNDEMDLNTWASFGLFRDQFLLDQRGSGALDSLNDTRENITQLGAQLNHRLDSHRASAGVEGSYERLDTERLTRTGTRTRAALYLQDEWAIWSDDGASGARLSVLPGARLDADSQFGVHPTPRLAVRWDPHRAFTVRTSWGWGFKAPDFRELYLLFANPSAGYRVTGNSDLSPEKSVDYNLGIEARPFEYLSLTAQAFHHQLTDRITTALAPADEVDTRRFRYENVDSAWTRGLETSARVNPVRGLQLEGSYSWTQSRDDRNGQPLPGQAKHRGALTLRFRAPSVGFSTQWKSTFVGSRPFFQDDDGDEIDERRDASAYTAFDIRVGQTLWWGVSAFLRGQNLFDARSEFLGLPPRHFSGGVSGNY